MTMWTSIKNVEFQASKRQTGASGRLHRTVTGEWVWCEEEETPETAAADAQESDDEASFSEDKRPMNELQKAESSGSDNEEEKAAPKVRFF